MNNDHGANDDVTGGARERLSALVDGELEAAVVVHACRHWCDDHEARRTWHTYHVIGDVLRSDDLASQPSADRRFLETLRDRLAAEPVVLAPRPLVSASPSAVRAARGWSWIAPATIAAGVVGVLMLSRSTGLLTDRASDGVAAAPAAAPVVVARGTPPAPSASPSEPETFVASGQVIRDARLDRYLAAHKQFAGSSALGVPSGFLRNATADMTDR